MAVREGTADISIMASAMHSHSMHIHKKIKAIRFGAGSCRFSMAAKMTYVSAAVTAKHPSALVALVFTNPSTCFVSNKARVSIVRSCCTCHSRTTMAVKCDGVGVDVGAVLVRVADQG